MSELITACRDGDIEKVKQLLDNNANVNESDSYMTPLITAAESQHVEVVKELLKHKECNVNASEYESTALHYATMRDNTEIILALLNCEDIDVNCQCSFGVGDGIPLHWSSHAGNMEAVKALLNKGADVTIFSRRCWGNCIQAAAESRASNSIEIMEELLKSNTVTDEALYWAIATVALQDHNCELNGLNRDKIYQKFSVLTGDVISLESIRNYISGKLAAGASEEDFEWGPTCSVSTRSHPQIIEFIESEIKSRRVKSAKN